MSSATVPAPLRLVTQIAADRAVSTTSVRFVQGILPEIERKLSEGEDRTQAYMGREPIAEHTGLSATHVLPTYYPKQLDEVGIVQMSRQGKFGLVEIGDGQWRGHASGWVADRDAYTPKDIPILELETEEYLVDVDQQAAVASLAPTTTYWAKNPEAHRLVLALVHHTGLKRVKLTAKQAGQILGKVTSTGHRVLKRLEKLGLYVKGWVDYAELLVDPTAVMADETHAESVRLAKVRRWSVFTREGWEIAGYAEQWMKINETMSEEEVREEHWSGLTKGLTRAIDYVRRVFSLPNATGRRVTVEDF